MRSVHKAFQVTCDNCDSAITRTTEIDIIDVDAVDYEDLMRDNLWAVVTIKRPGNPVYRHDLCSNCAGEVDDKCGDGERV